MNPRASHRGDPSSFGFTIIELMVAIGMTSIVAVGLYSLSVVAASTFQEQQRISEVQLRLRTAMEWLRADAARAGYMSTPASANGVDPMVCPPPSAPMQGVFLEQDTPNPTYDPADNANINPVHLQLTGDFVNTDEYRIMGINGTQVFLQNQTEAYSRVTSADILNRIFANRTVRLMGTNGQMQFNTVTGVMWQPPGPGPLPSVTLATAPVIIGNGGRGCGLAGLGVGATIAPITTISYRIAAGTNDFGEIAQTSTGKTDLVREELQPGAGGMLVPVLGTRRTVAEFAVDFDVAALIDDAMPGAIQPTLLRLPFDDVRNFGVLGVTGTGAAAPQRVRSLTVRISVRDRLQDRDFGWTPRVPSTPLTRFRVFPDQSGAARVRSLTTEIEVPNIALRNLR